MKRKIKTLNRAFVMFILVITTAIIVTAASEPDEHEVWFVNTEDIPAEYQSHEPEVMCLELGGQICNPFEGCEGGEFVYADDSGSRCCVRGSCLDPTPIETDEVDIPEEPDLRNFRENSVDYYHTNTRKVHILTALAILATLTIIALMLLYPIFRKKQHKPA